MNEKKLLFALLALFALCPVSFAASWVATSGMAIAAAAAILGIILMIGYGFSSQELKLIAQDELYQLIVTLFIFAFVVSITTGVDAAAGTVTDSDTLQGAALSELDSLLEDADNNFGDLKGFSRAAGYEASKGFYCALQGAGYSINSCGSYRQLLPPLSLAAQMISVSVAELESLRTLVLFGKNYMFTLLLPAAIILRAFKVTRGAGAFLMAFALSLYLIVPFTVLGMKELADAYTGAEIESLPSSSDTGFDDYDCDEEETGSDAGGNFGTVYNYKTAFSLFEEVEGNLDGYLYAFLIKGTMITVVSVFAFITGVRWLSKLAGAEVDVSGLMRLA